jgi:hypothetical protein
MVAVAGLLSLVLSPTPTSVEGVTCVTVGAETLMYRDRGEPPTIARRLVDRYIPAMLSQRRALASTELTSPRQRAFHLQHRRTLEQRADLMMGPMIFGCCELWEPSEQGRCGGYVLAHPGEVWEVLVLLDDPLVYVVGDGMCTPTISTTFNLVLELHVLQL